MLHLYNSYSKKKEAFTPLKKKTVTMYNCGPTVYDFIHIGNLRAFLFADILRRYLDYRGYKVKQVMNITDVGHMVNDGEQGEDKIALAARREGKGPLEIARFYEEKFFEDIRAMGLLPAWKYPRASEHIPEMIAIIKRLIKRGHAYLVPEGKGHSVYYDLSTFPKYGKLSGNKVEELIAGARVEVKQEKRNPYDFALWIYKPEHVLQWETPWGRGYPGWHLECSAMSMKYLGHTLDIHTGGEDNKFPHHECEIAQSEGATGKPFARTWMHVKHLQVEGKKMSKSLGNFYTLNDLVQKGYSPRVVRFVLMSTHYRETLNFTLEGLKAAQSALSRVDELVEKLQSKTSSARLQSRKGDAKASHYIDTARKEFIAAMDDDLNISKALAALFEFIRAMNQVLSNEVTSNDKHKALKFLKEVNKVLGLGIGERKRKEIPAEIIELAEAREQARKEKDWVRADQLREEIQQHGYVVEDTLEGPKVTPLRIT